MTKAEYNYLEKKTNELGASLRKWISSVIQNKQIIDHGTYKEILLPMPGEIIQAGKTKINISLHQEPFDNVKHFHNFYEIIYVYNGEITNIIDDNVINLKTNDCIIQYPEVKHMLTNFNSKKSIVINITLDKTFFATSYYKILFETNRFFSSNEKDQKIKYVVCKNLNNIVKKIMDIMLYMFLSNSNYSDSSYENILVLLLMEILKNNENVDSDSFVYKLYSYITSNIATISLNSCAAYFSYHPKYFCSLVKTKTGSSFREIVIEKKIEKAVYYLTNTDYSNAKISELIGYENSLSFYTNFKQKFNMSPTQYRSKHKVKKLD